MRLLVISHTPHYQQNGIVSAWGATVRELDQLASLFTEVIHLAPLYSEAPPESSLPYTSSNIRFVPVRPAGGNSFREKLSIFVRIPSWLKVMKREISEADAIHIRCPAGVSLIGLLAQWFWGKEKPCWVKYAGNWNPPKGEPLSYKLQRFWLAKNFQRGVVTVNGQWEGQPAHVVTFKNPSFSRTELTQAASLAEIKQLTIPIRLLFVGRVEVEKGAGRVIEIADGLQKHGVNFHLDMIGDGPARTDCEQSVSIRGLTDQVFLVGWKSRVEINDYYRNAHIILLPSTASEGWPKALSEAMAFGVVPLASTTSSIPFILSAARVGKALPVESIDAYVNAIISYTEDVREWKNESTKGVAAAEGFTYEHYLNEVADLFFRAWKVDLRTN